MKCSSTGCESESTAQGLCRKHYMREWRSVQQGSEAHRQRNWLKERRALELTILKTVHNVQHLQEMNIFVMGTTAQDRLLVPRFLDMLTGILEAFVHEPKTQTQPQLEVVKVKP